MNVVDENLHMVIAFFVKNQFPAYYSRVDVGKVIRFYKVSRRANRHSREGRAGFLIDVEKN